MSKKSFKNSDFLDVLSFLNTFLASLTEIHFFSKLSAVFYFSTNKISDVSFPFLFLKFSFDSQ